jgi:hypothetical protein
MGKIRVLVANRPRLMRELVLETISDQPDTEIVGEVTDTADIERMVAESKPDFVIRIESDHKLFRCRAPPGLPPNPEALGKLFDSDRRRHEFFRILYVDGRNSKVPPIRIFSVSFSRNTCEVERILASRDVV